MYTIFDMGVHDITIDFYESLNLGNFAFAAIYAKGNSDHRASIYCTELHQ